MSIPRDSGAAPTHFWLTLSRTQTEWIFVGPRPRQSLFNDLPLLRRPSDDGRRQLRRRDRLDLGLVARVRLDRAGRRLDPIGWLTR
jgi:hypothetical protein